MESRFRRLQTVGDRFRIPLLARSKTMESRFRFYKRAKQWNRDSIVSPGRKRWNPDSIVKKFKAFLDMRGAELPREGTSLLLKTTESGFHRRNFKAFLNMRGAELPRVKEKEKES